MKKFLLVACAIAVPAFAADPPADKAKPKPIETFIEPAKAEPDFQIQGEYTGDVPGGKAGFQVIADGDGQFTGRALRGGLPGDGWDGTAQVKFTAKTQDGKTPFEFTTPSNFKIAGVIGDGKIVATGPDGKPVELKRVVRKSPTEGAKPPAGAIVLFDGKNADEWDKGKVENDLLSVMVPGGQTSKKKFGDCSVHAEFMLPFMPRARGQARANSGVYLQGCYEVQVLDSFALEGKNNECGGIYGLGDPKVNMCYPPLQWQTYDIDYTAPRFGSDGKKTSNARITVKHNGVLVQDNFEITRDTTAAAVKESAEPGPINLQNHGNPIFYRNIWVVEKK
jgi:hypothetical protein